MDTDLIIGPTLFSVQGKSCENVEVFRLPKSRHTKWLPCLKNSKFLEDLSTLFFVYNMYISGMLYDISPQAIINGMKVNNLFLGGICAIYLAVESVTNL